MRKDILTEGLVDFSHINEIMREIDNMSEETFKRFFWIADRVPKVFSPVLYLLLPAFYLVLIVRIVAYLMGKGFKMYWEALKYTWEILEPGKKKKKNQATMQDESSNSFGFAVRFLNWLEQQGRK